VYQQKYEYPNLDAVANTKSSVMIPIVITDTAHRQGDRVGGGCLGHRHFTASHKDRNPGDHCRFFFVAWGGWKKVGNGFKDKKTGGGISS
jgi:hypothetical protein